MQYLHLKRFGVLSDELQKLKYGRFVNGEEKPIVIPS